MPASRKTKTRWILGSLAGVVSLVVLVAIWADLRKGLESLGWQRVPATIVEAYYHHEHDPEASHGMDGAFHKTWKGLVLAYTTNGGEHHLANAFDVAGLTRGREWFPRPTSACIRHVLHKAEAPEVFYNPDAPQEAVLQVGIPYTAGVVLMIPFCLLLVVAAGLHARFSRKDTGFRLHASIGGLVLLLVFFAMAGLGLAHFWVTVFRIVPPWWLLPGCYLLVIVCVFTPRGFEKWRSPIAMVPLLLFIVGFAGWFMAREESFGIEWSEEDHVERLKHSHPVVGEYAAVHFIRNTAPPAALEPLRDLVVRSPALDTRRFAANALERMGEGAIAALPELRLALQDPRNEAIRGDLESAIKTLDNHRLFRERKGVEED